MITKRIIINLSKDEESIRQIVDQVTRKADDWSFMDFSGSKFEFENVNCFSARILDSNNQIEKFSIHEYVNSVGNFSIKQNNGRNIRQLQINGLPIYWLTNFAEKHPFKHWMFSFFFFKSFVKEKPDFFNEYGELIIIAPVSEKILNGYIEQNWPEFSQKSKVIPSVKPIHLSSWKTLYKASRFCLKYLFSYCLKSISPKMLKNFDQPDLMLINAGNSSSKSVLKQYISNFLENKGAYLEVDLQSSIFRPANCNSAFLTKNYPNPRQVLGMLVQILKYSGKVTSSHKMADAKNDFWKTIINEELYNALQLTPLFFIHLWLSRIFSSTHKSLKVFYEDEMYKTGRIISSAANISNNAYIKTIAYQHGNISENHAVYRFCDAEISDSKPGNNDAIPLPGTFLVWGEYFKRQFLEWCSPNPENVVVAGNLVYLELQKRYPQNKLSGKSIKNILWCTTSLEFAKSEFEIMQRELEANNFSISLRMHPYYNIKDALRQFIPDSLYAAISWDTTPDIYDAINNSDVVVCSGHSTVFIDCLILKKPVIRLFNLSVMNDYLTGTEVFVKNALSEDEFAEALSFFRSRNNTNNISEYLFLESDEIWQKVVSTQ